jgi:hypothetical protein
MTIVKHVTSDLQKYNEIVVVGILLIISTLMIRIIVSTVQIFQITVPFRVMIGLNILFNFIFPVVLVWVGFQRTAPLLSFAVPFIAVGVLGAVADSLWLGHIDLLLYLPYMISSLIAGLGFGIIGVGASQYRSQRVIALSLLIIGFIILVANAPNLIIYVIYVLSGTGLESLMEL